MHIKNIHEIIEAARVEEVIADYVGDLKKRGSGLVACCPFHGEKTPSFHVHPARGIWKCFGCGKGGDAVAFLTERGDSFPEAIRKIAEKYKIPVEYESRRAEPDPKHELRQRIRATLAAVQAHFAAPPDDPEKTTPAMAYWQGRGFDAATLDAFGVGFCDGTKPFGVENAALIEAGIANPETGSLSHYGRVTLPIHDHNGNIVSFAGRSLDAEAKGDKYLNGRNVDGAYQKGQFLYNFHRARAKFRETGELWIVEGYADAIALYQVGAQNAVALCGTALTDAHLALLKSFNGARKLKFWVCLDADKAGRAAMYGDGETQGIVERLLRIGQVNVVSFPDRYKDIAEFICHQKPDVDFLKIDATDGIYRLVKIWWRENAAPYEKGIIQTRIASLLSSITPENVRDIYINQICGNIGLTPKGLESLVKRHLSHLEIEERNKVANEYRYLKVGDTYLERIPQHDIFTKSTTITYKRRLVGELKIEKGVDFIKNLPRFVDFITIPDHLQYQRTFALKHEGHEYQYFNQYEPLPFTAKKFDLPAAFYADKENFDYTQIPEIANTARFFNHIFDAKNYANRFVKIGFDWVTLCYLHPKQRLQALALVSSEEGTGKSTFINLMMAIFGQNATKTEAARMTKSFNQQMANKLLICIEETKDQKGEVENLLKDLITGFEKVVEPKHQDSRTVKSFDKFIFASNHEDSFMKVGQATTRFFVMKVNPIEKREDDFEEKLYREIPYFLYFMQERSVLTPKDDRLWFNPALLENEALLRLRQSSKDIVQQNMEELIQTIFLRTEVTAPVLRFSTEYLTRLMQAYGGKMYEQKTPNYFQKVAVTDLKMYQVNSPTKFRQIIMKGTTHEMWPAQSRWEYEEQPGQGRYIEFPIWRYMTPYEFFENYAPDRRTELLLTLEKSLSTLQARYGNAPQKWHDKVQELWSKAPAPAEMETENMPF